MGPVDVSDLVICEQSLSVLEELSLMVLQDFLDANPVGMVV